MNISKGHIYYIFYNLNPHILYIGSTFNELKHRWLGHKSSYKNKKNSLSIHEYFDKYGIENFTMKLLKSYDVYREHNKDNKHLQAYEQLWINKLKCVNERKSFNILRKEQKKEWYNNNKEKIIEQQKKYNDDNKEHIAEKNKEYRENNKEKITCECGSIVLKYALTRHKKTKKHINYFNTLDL